MWRGHANTFCCRLAVPLLFVFLMATCPLCKSKGCNRTCGSQNFSYPFALKGQKQACGSQILDLECVRGSPYLSLNQSTYRIINFSASSITIDPLIDGNCGKPNLKSFNLNEFPQLSISPQNRIQVYDCTNRENSTSLCKEEGINGNEKCPAATSFICLSADTNQSRDYRSIKEYLNSTEGCLSFASWVVAAAVDTFSSSSSPSYGFQLDLAFPGTCLQNCSLNARCTQIITTVEKYYCQCQGGFYGDGYVEGSGCTANDNRTSSKSGTLTAVTVAGIIGGATIVAAIVIACAILRCRQSALIGRKRKGYIHQLANILALKDDTTTQLFGYRELERATKRFSPSQQLGTGASGAVYAGMLPDGRLVAVKRIHFLNSQGLQQVVNEVSVLSSVRHRNLVRLLGCCIEKGDPLLVFEYVANGTLAEHLQRNRGQGLNWLTRISIASETAEALAYLHSLNPPIYHRDVKSRNILLDSNFNAKVADFGLSRLVLSLSDASHISTIPQGTPGYLDPEYHQNFHLSDKSDVYSFGVVLIEIITALKPVDFSRDKKEVNLAALAVAKIGNGYLDEILDPFLEVDKQTAIRSMVQRVAELAFRCLSYDKDARPKMREVLEELLLVRGASTGLFELCPSVWAAGQVSSERSGDMTEDRLPYQGKDYVPVNAEETLSPTSVQVPWDSKHTSPTESLTESLSSIG